MAAKKKATAKKASAKADPVPHWVNVFKEHVSSEMKGFAEGLELKLEVGLGQVNDRLDGVDKRLDGVDKRLDRVEDAIRTHSKEIAVHSKELAGVKKRLEGVEDAIRTHTDEIKDLRRRVV